LSHKTLYIDIDEEITSIVDRVRKAQVNEIIVVVPKRALLIQSLVNLKLLKKEANRRKKRMMIVTQDRVGKKLIEKAGILVQGKMDEAMEEEVNVAESLEQKGSVQKLELEDGSEEEQDIGSSEYFDEPFPAAEKQENIKEISFEKKKIQEAPKPDLREAKKTVGKAETKIQKAKRGSQVRISDIVASPPRGKGKKSKTGKPEEEKRRLVPAPGGYFQSRELQRQRELEAEKFFQNPIAPSPSFSRKEEKVLKTTRIKGKTGKYFAIFAITFLVLGAIASAYFFLPHSTIVLHLATREKSVSLNVEASAETSEINVEKSSLPVALEQITKEKSGEFEATGSQSGAGKAGGKVVIYNEFSAGDQPLMATTRLETSDGKIFRITKGVVVPGMAKVGTETKPGAIEVDVVADKPGEEYNIEPATFKIPGFKGGPKYDKFYAKSAKAMEGGTKGEAATITSQDVAQAKEKLVAEAKKEALEDLKSRLGPSRYFFEDTATFDLVDSSSSESVGSQAQKFIYTINVKARILSFQEEDVKELIRNKEKAGDTGLVQINFDRSINYILAAADIEKGSLKFEAKTDINVAGGIDLENFKKGVLGKNSAELEAFIKNYPSIKNADVNFWPFFTSRVPMRESRVKIEVQ
jgi:hypothetical protein